MGRVMVRASELAGVAGMHAFRDQDECVAEVMAQFRGGKRKREETKCAAELASVDDATLLQSAAQMKVASEAVQACKDKDERAASAKAADSTARETASLATKQRETAEQAVDEAKKVQDEARKQMNSVKGKAEKKRAEAVCAAANERVEKATQVLAARKSDEDAKSRTAEDTKKESLRAAAEATDTRATVIPRLKVELVKEVDAQAMCVAKRESASVNVPVALEQVAQQHVRMAQGTVDESDILAKARRLDPALSEADGHTEFKAMLLGTCKHGQIRLVGMADAIDPKSRYVVEIKRRKNRLFGSIPLYERIQLEAYMRLYGVMDGALVQSHGGCVEIHWVEQDDDLWERVLLAVSDALDGVS